MQQLLVEVEMQNYHVDMPIRFVSNTAYIFRGRDRRAQPGYFAEKVENKTTKARYRLYPLSRQPVEDVEGSDPLGVIRSVC